MDNEFRQLARDYKNELIGHPFGKPGTIACLVRKTEGGNNADFILSNNHVLANVNQGKFGDFIIQPGISDGGKQVIPN